MAKQTFADLYKTYHTDELKRLLKNSEALQPLALEAATKELKSRTSKPKSDKKGK